MIGKLEKVGAILAATLGLATAEIKLLTADDNPSVVLKEHEYTVVSFFSPMHKASLNTHKVILGAEVYFNQMISKGEWHERNIGWLMVDLDATPELAFESDPKPTQAVIGPYKHRMLDFDLGDIIAESDNAVNFAKIVNELTGNWVAEIKCEEVQGEGRHYYDELVYFGAKADLLEGGSMDFLNTVSMIDRYTHDEQPMGFFVNDDV